MISGISLLLFQADNTNLTSDFLTSRILIHLMDTTPDSIQPFIKFAIPIE
jgi:hypothetical protein